MRRRLIKTPQELGVFLSALIPFNGRRAGISPSSPSPSPYLSVNTYGRRGSGGGIMGTSFRGQSRDSRAARPRAVAPRRDEKSSRSDRKAAFIIAAFLPPSSLILPPPSPAPHVRAPNPR